MKINIKHSLDARPLPLDLLMFKIYKSVRPQAKTIPVEVALEWYEARELGLYEHGKENPFDKYMDLDLDKVEIELSPEDCEYIYNFSEGSKEFDLYELLEMSMKNWYEMACIYLTRLENKRAFMKYPIKGDLNFEWVQTYEEAITIKN